jgi:complement component 1 Q subcomponent-binding protein
LSASTAIARYSTASGVSPRCCIAKRTTGGALTFNRRNKTTRKVSLPDLLAKEIAEEKSIAEEEEDVDEDLEAVRTSVLKSFELTEEEGLTTIKLTREFNGETIEVVFDCEDEEEPPLEDEEERVEDEEEEQSYEGTGSGINFTVRIQKDDSAILFKCVATSTEIAIKNETFSEKPSLSVHETYSGPQFYQLDDDLQAAFYEYLRARSIDEDLSYFIVEHSQRREQKEYLRWLELLHSFTAKK